MKFSELRKRLVFKVGLFHLALGWLIVQIVGTLTPVLGFPGILVRGLAFMFIMGYPLVTVLAWIYEVTNSRRSVAPVSPGRLYYAVVGSMVLLAVAIMLADIFLIHY
jgi:multisubunit Na+/H+ antiporter MnhB subunit